MRGGTGRQANDREWAGRSFVRPYASRVLRPPEVLLLARYREALRGRVLELGCGAGRITGYLIALAQEVRAIDLSPAMVAYCNARYPAGLFEVRDLRDLVGIAGAPFDVVFAGFNVLDVLDHEDRLDVLGQIAQVLTPAGLLIMSTHNRGHVPAVARPLQLPATRNPLRLARRLAAMPVDVYHSSRLRPLERAEETYALVNDNAHHFRFLHYYISRDAQARQFAETGYELLECLDEEGETVAEGDARPESAELYYVARRAT